MGALSLKHGAKLDRMTIAGACIVGALLRTAANLPFDLVITSGTDGEHTGPLDPHIKGEAYDVRCNDRPTSDDEQILRLVMGYLAEFTHQAGKDSLLVSVGGGLGNGLFFGFRESPDSPIEHLHIQRRNGRTFPAESALV